MRQPSVKPFTGNINDVIVCMNKVIYVWSSVGIEGWVYITSLSNGVIGGYVWVNSQWQPFSYNQSDIFPYVTYYYC